MGILKKKNRGGSTRIPLPFFTVFNMGDPPTINVSKVLKCKINHNFFLSQKHDIPKRGGRGGVPDLGKILNIFFLVNVPKFNIFPQIYALFCRILSRQAFMHVLKSCSKLFATCMFKTRGGPKAV